MHLLLAAPSGEKSILSHVVTEKVPLLLGLDGLDRFH